MGAKKIIFLYALGLFAAAAAVACPACSWISPLTYMVILPLGIILLWEHDKSLLLDFGYRLTGGWLRALAKGLLIGLAIPILFAAVPSAAGWMRISPRGISLGDFLFYFFAVLLKMGIVVAVEEFVFRGFFLGYLSRNRSIGWPLMLSSLLWGIGHLASMAAGGLAPGLIIVGMATFLVWGIGLGLAYLRTERSLWLPYGIHLGVNISFSTIGLFFITLYAAPEWWIGNAAWVPESGLLGLAGWIFLSAVFFFITGNKGKTERKD